MSGTLALAASIAAMDRPALEQLVEVRRVLSPASVHEPLGLAIELLRPDSVSRALQSAHRDSLAALLALSTGKAHDEDRGALRALAADGLVGLDTATGDAVSLPEVQETLFALGFPGDAAGSDPSPQADPIAERPSPDPSAWYGAALTSVRRAAQLLRSIARRPVRLGRKSRPAVASVRELAEAAHCEPDAVDRLLDVLRAAGLLVELPGASGQQLGLSANARGWLALDYPQRWLALAEAAGSLIDARLRRGLEETPGELGAVVRRLSFDFPLLPEAELEALERVSLSADDLGLAVGGRLAPAALELLSGDRSAALRIAEQQIPAPVTGVYLQPDLSLIVPGPLQPEDEAALSAIADTEQLGPAASLRLSAGTLARAAQRGIAPAAIRELLQRLSLTGIPQPLDYLLGDLERKLAEGTASMDDELRSYAPAPALPVASHEHETETEAEQPEAPSGELAEMVERVFTAARESGGEGELTRRLKLAIRDRSAVQVTAVAGSDERIFTLLPVSLQGGRLRASDQQAGVERTLPVSAITAVEAA